MYTRGPNAVTFNATADCYGEFYVTLCDVISGTLSPQKPKKPNLNAGYCSEIFRTVQQV